LIGGTAIGYERALSVLGDQDPDAAGSSSPGPDDPGRDAIGPKHADECPARRIAPDGRNQLRRNPDPGQPAGRVRS
jgi:hypothetical protein